MTQPMYNEIDAAKAKRETATEDARAQADEFDGFTADEIYTSPTGERFVVPNVTLLDDEQQEQFDLLNFALSKCDKHPDTEIPGRTVTAKDPDGTEVVTEYPPQIIRGGFVQPYQKDGELVTPNYNVQLVQAFLGKDGYAKFKAAKGKSSEYAAAVKKLSEKLTEREADDPKSEGGSSALADVSD